MIGYVAKRLALLVPILAGVSIIVFLLIQLAPGDPSTSLLGPRSTPEAREALRRDLGLDQPLPVQYVKWVASAVQLDLGESVAKSRPVSELAWTGFKNTLVLTAGASVFAVVAGLALGAIGAVRQFSRSDRAAMGVALFLTAVPGYWLGMLLVALFAVELRLLPSGGMRNVVEDGGTLDVLRHLLLPALAAGAVAAGIIARTVRASLLEVLGLDFVQALRAAGLPERTILARHVLRNALPPILSMVGLQIGYLLSGVVFIEVVFSWPGIGLLIFESIGQRDLPMLLGGVLVVSLAFVLINLVVDVLHMLIDPRLRHAAT